MSNQPKDLEYRMQKALFMYEHDITQKIILLLCQFQVPYQHFLHSLRGTYRRQVRKPCNYILDKHQEDAVRYWIYQMDRIGMAPSVKTLVHTANSILQHSVRARSRDIREKLD